MRERVHCTSRAHSQISTIKVHLAITRDSRHESPELDSGLRSKALSKTQVLYFETLQWIPEVLMLVSTCRDAPGFEVDTGPQQRSASPCPARLPADC